MSYHGPSEVFLLLDGYDLLLSDVSNLEFDQEAETAERSGLGENARKHSPTGLSQSAVSLEGTVFDDGSKRSEEALNQLSTAPDATDRIFSLGMQGTSIGSETQGFEGAVAGRYSVIASLDDLQRVAATFMISGARDPGSVLHPLAQETSDDNTQSTSVNNGSSSTGGLVGYFHLNAFDGDTGDQITVTIQESSDDSTYADVLSFSAASDTGEPTAERATTEPGGIEQYLAARWAFTDSGLGDATFFVSARRT